MNEIYDPYTDPDDTYGEQSEHYGAWVDDLSEDVDWYCVCIDPTSHSEDGPERRNPPTLMRCPDCGTTKVMQ